LKEIGIELLISRFLEKSGLATNACLSHYADAHGHHQNMMPSLLTIQLWTSKFKRSRSRFSGKFWFLVVISREGQMPMILTYQ